MTNASGSSGVPTVPVSAVAAAESAVVGPAAEEVGTASLSDVVVGAAADVAACVHSSLSEPHRGARVSAARAIAVASFLMGHVLWWGLMTPRSMRLTAERRGVTVAGNS